VETIDVKKTQLLLKKNYAICEFMKIFGDFCSQHLELRYYTYYIFL